MAFDLEFFDYLPTELPAPTIPLISTEIVDIGETSIEQLEPHRYQVWSSLQSFNEKFYCESFGEAIAYYNRLVRRYLAQIADWNAEPGNRDYQESPYQGLGLIDLNPSKVCEFWWCLVFC